MELLERYRKQLVRILISLLMLGFYVTHVAQWKQWDFIDKLESFAYDARLLFTLPGGVDERLVIVDIDEKSLAAEGRWPWSRNRLAAMVDSLFDHYGVKLVGFDVVFAEPEESSGLRVLDELARSGLGDNATFRREFEKLRKSLDHDRQFAESLAGRPVILGYFFSGAGLGSEAPQVGALPEPVFRSGQFTGRNIAFMRASGYGANLEQLQRNALGAGHFNPTIDPDGVVRRVPMLYEYAGDYYEALSLAMARAWIGVDEIRPGYPAQSRAGESYSAFEWLEVGPRRVPVDRQVQTLVPYRGKQGSYPYVSATDVIQQRADPALLKDKVVLVGTSAAGLLDLRSAPVQNVFPGVEIHANLITGIFDGTLKGNPAYTQGAEMVILVVAGLAMALALPLLSPIASAGFSLVMLAAVIGANLYFWSIGNLVLPLAATVLAVLSLFAFNTLYGFFIESRGKRQLAGLFGQYVPPELVDEMSESLEGISMDSENRHLTVLFSDVRGFTTISEGLNPQELSDLMNAYLTPMTRIIHQHRGTIDKYMGDAIMAFWGAPLADPEHARHALQAAMAMLAELHRMGPEFVARGWPELHIGVGLNTGQMNVGNMGSEFRRAYTVLGDAVNLGSRLEGQTKTYGVELIVSESTRDEVPEYTYRELDRIRVKGKDKPVTIYEPLCLSEELSREAKKELELYHQALKLYRAQNWDMAELQFLNLQKQSPDRALYRVYAERIIYYRQNPPGADWDGVYTATTK